MKKMPDEIKNEAWDRLTGWFRRARPSDESAPFGFATRVVAQYREARQNELFRIWERMSIRAAIGCACFAAIFGVYSIIAEQINLKQQVLFEPPSDPAADFAGFELKS